MTSLATHLRRAVLGMSPREATFARRGFAPGDPRVVAHLEWIGEAFLAGYNAAVAVGTPDALGQALPPVPRPHLGFAMEGAAMGFTLLDQMAPLRRDRFPRFLEGAAVDHAYTAHVGAGWALARLHDTPFGRALEQVVAPMHPVLRWLVVDGYGFHEGYFHPQRAALRPPVWNGAYTARAFDQGLGRSLWFSCCADPVRIGAAIARLPRSRHGDLWSGVGLACTYAGGVPDEVITALASHGAEHAAEIAQGAAFATAARRRAGLLVDHTVRACRILCGVEPEAAAAVAESSLGGLVDTPLVPAFEAWRRRIAAHFDARSRRLLSLA